MSGPLDELRRTGTLGPAGVELLYRTVRQVVRTRNIPPPAGEATWSLDALTAVAHEIFLGRPNGQQGEARLLILATTSGTEEIFRSKLWTLVANDLVSTGRRTERGRIAERIKDLCADLDGVSISAGIVSRAGAVQGDGSFDKVVVALSGVPIAVPAWDALSTRAAPATDRASLSALVQAALDVTGTLPLPLLVDAVAVRLQIQDLPDLMEVDALDRSSPLPDVERQSAIDDAAVHFLAELTDAQRLVVPYLNDSATETAQRTGLKRTRAWQCMRDVQDIIRRDLQDEDDAALVLRRASEVVLGFWSPT
jgi:hypothetical protein